MAYDVSTILPSNCPNWVSWVCFQRLLASAQWEASVQAVPAARVAAAAPAVARAAQAAPVLGALAQRFE